MRTTQTMRTPAVSRRILLALGGGLGCACALGLARQFDAPLSDPAARERHPIDPALLDQLHALASALGAAPVFEVVGASRESDREAARPGLHARGRALDVRLAGVSCADLSAAAVALAAGGVGYYRALDFVHLDTGAPRSWRG